MPQITCDCDLEHEDICKKIQDQRNIPAGKQKARRQRRASILI